LGKIDENVVASVLNYEGEINIEKIKDVCEKMKKVSLNIGQKKFIVLNFSSEIDSNSGELVDINNDYIKFINLNFLYLMKIIYD
jgi:hypothetical protein